MKGKKYGEHQTLECVPDSYHLREQPQLPSMGPRDTTFVTLVTLVASSPIDLNTDNDAAAKTAASATLSANTVPSDAWSPQSVA